MNRLRQGAAAAAAAIFGFAIAVALLPAWLRPARPGQLPAFMTRAGLDARASYNFYFGLVILTLLAPLAMRPLIRRLAEGRRWALNAAAAAMASALWIALAQETLAWVIVPPLLVVFAAERLRFRRMSFTRRDAVLVPFAMTVFMAITDIKPDAAFGRRVVVGAGLVLLVRLLLPLIRRGLAAATCCAFAPLALMLQSHYVGYRQRHLGWPPLLFALLVPFALRLLLDRHRRLQRAIAYAVYPIVILAYASATSTFAAEGKPHADLFEDAHNLTVASEMLRGERPYRDIVPTHGLIHDGLLDYLVLRFGKQTAGRANAAHGVIGSIVSVATYAVTACAAGSPHVGLLGYFLAAVMNIAGGGVRAAPSLFVLALLAAGLRRRRPHLFAWAALVLVVAFLTSLDMGLYAAVAFLVALWRLPRETRPAALRATLAGSLAAGVVVFVAFLASGMLIPFFRTILFELPPLASLYSLTPFAPSDALRAHRFPPEVLGAFFDAASFLYVVFAIVLGGVAVLLQMPRDGRRDALLLLGVWTIAAGLAYAERQHLFFQYAVAPIAATAAALLARRHRAAAALFILALLILAKPAEYLAGIDIRRHAHGPFDPDAVSVDDVPRARGALYRSKDAAVIRSAYKYVSALPPGDTYFDFTNRGALYFLLDRDCPIRQVEVAFYQRPELQAEVLARLQLNTRIAAALIPKPDDPTAVDGIPNRERAPLVWQYLRQHFRPDFEEGDVVFWRRVW